MLDFWTWRKPFRSIKFAIQRMKKGYCDYDTWDIDAYLDQVLPGMLRQMADEGKAHPYDTTPEKWAADLKYAAHCIEKAAKLDMDWGDGEFDGAEKFKCMNENAIKAKWLRKTAFEWIVEHYRDLWW